MARSRKVSQVQLAKELGVSQPLISLVLNGRREGINAETFDRVWQHAVKRGYRLKGVHVTPPSQPRQVGFILRAPMRLYTRYEYFSRVQHGLHSALMSHGLTTSFLGSEDLVAVDDFVRLLHPGNLFRGIVLFGEVRQQFLRQLLQYERKVVAVSARYPGMCHSVVGDETAALADLVQHLHGLGHRRIGWLGGNVGLGRHEARFSAFKVALTRFGLPLPGRYVTIHELADSVDGLKAIQSMLGHSRRSDFPSAFICYNGTMASGALLALEQEGWRVPDDLSIACADAPRIARAGQHRVTGAGSDPEQLGEAAAGLVLECTGADDETYREVVVPSHLVVGDSTGPARG